MKNPLFSFAAVLGLVMSAGTLHATTLTLTAAADSSIFAAYPNNDFGASTLVTGSNGVGTPGRGLVRFDLSSIPAGAEITNASITMTVVKVPPGDQHAGPADSSFGMFRMLVPWQEGSGGGTAGSAAQAGDTTWYELGARGVAAWGTPGGQIGTDFANDSSTATTVGDGYGNIVWGATPNFLADLQGWLDHPETNFGYMMISDQESTPGTARRLASRETFDSNSVAPTLMVDYTVPEPGPGLLLAAGALAMARRRVRGN